MRSSWRWLGFGMLALGVTAGGYFLIRGATQNGNAQDLDPSKDQAPVPTFLGWPKPDLAIVVSGQTYGYLQPCGCSDPQKGGLARRYNFMQTLKAKGWPVTAVDLGDIAQSSGPHQRLKYVVAMNALRLMDYRAIGIGKNEFLMPLTEALASYSINNEQPRPVAVNLAKTDDGEIFHDLNVRKGEIFNAGKFKVGVFGSIGDQTATDIKQSLPPDEKEISFLNNVQIFPRALAGLAKAKVDISILLYQGGEKKAKDVAEFLHGERLKNSTLGPVHILLCSTAEEEPRAYPQKHAGAPETSVVAIGHKGRYVGVFGVWKSTKGIDLKYQLVAIGPELQSKPLAPKDNPVAALIEKYAADVRDGNYLARFPRDNHEVQASFKDARYVGSEMCAGCHDDAAAKWSKSAHAHAFDTLVTKAKDPKLRQFDGECVACHTVGFKHHTGYYDPPPGATAKEKEKHNLKLLNVGCESCHGPGSLHANNPNNAEYYPWINPYRPTAKEADSKTPADERDQLLQRRQLRIDGHCQKCHDSDNDVHWGNVPFEKKWNLIAHPTPKKGVNAAQAK